ncbi:MAG: class I SAM-dependent methyltransferase [Brumimicrobium sp.]
MNEKELKELAAQLSKPKGLPGVEVAEIMHETNKRMTLHSIERLSITDNENILELGHGNCSHLSEMLKPKMTYCGLEVSDLMNKEAIRINQQYIDNQQAIFYLYDGLKIPFKDNFFDKAFTVNTIYFWTDPKYLIAELYRVLKPKGILNITFALKKFMQQLPFTKYGFTLYDNDKIKRLIDTSPFTIINIDTETETVKSKTGESAKRAFITVTVKK